MRKIMDYKIIEFRYDNKPQHSYKVSIEKEIREAIRDGWVPIGGICTIPDSGCIYQAMVKHENK